MSAICKHDADNYYSLPEYNQSPPELVPVHANQTKQWKSLGLSKIWGWN